jgi:hypothetical protein
MTIILPFFVTLPRKTKADKVWHLNLNEFRNTHFQILNQAKRAWKDIVEKTYWLNPFTPGNAPYRFTYTLYPLNNRKFDTSNVCSIVDKFTCDALVEIGVIPNDSYKIIPVIVYQFGHVDRENPRVELTIESICEPFTAEDEQIQQECF